MAGTAVTQPSGETCNFLRIKEQKKTITYAGNR
jgi:hypothetical protein